MSNERVMEAARRIVEYWKARGITHPEQSNVGKRNIDELTVARALLSSSPGGDGMRKALEELADQAEHDMKINQTEEGGGWWSIKTEWAIKKARAALDASRTEEKS